MKSEKEKVGRLACRVVRPDPDFDPNNSRPVLLVLLHGYGANAEDLRPLAEFFARSVTTRPLFVLVPDAPFGDWARSWFEIEDALKAFKQQDDVAVSSSTSLSSPPVSSDERPSLSELVPSVADSISQLVECVVLFAETELQKNNNKEEEKKDWELVIGGFSQGGMMALELLSFLPLPLLSRLSFLALWSTLSLSPRRLLSSLGRFSVISDTKTNEIEKDKDTHNQDRYCPLPPIDAAPASTPPTPVVGLSAVLKPQPQVLRIEQSHGEADVIVPLSQALRLSSLLAALPPSSFTHRLFLFPGQHELCPEALHSLLEHLKQTR